MKWFVLLMFLVGCGHTVGQRHMYRFTCPNGSIVRFEVTQQELRDQETIYNKVILTCKSND